MHHVTYAKVHVSAITRENTGGDAIENIAGEILLLAHYNLSCRLTSLIVADIHRVTRYKLRLFSIALSDNRISIQVVMFELHIFTLATFGLSSYNQLCAGSDKEKLKSLISEFETLQIN